MYVRGEGKAPCHDAAVSARSLSGATVVRQRGSVLLGACAILACAIVLVSSLDGLSLGLVGGLLLAAAASYVVLVRPSLAVGIDGLAVNNPLRRVRVPWPRVEGCRDRWNLQIDVGERLVTVWAISSHRDRPAGGGPFGAGGRASRAFPELEAPRPDRTTAGSVGRQVEAARREWAELVAGGEVVADEGAPVVARWDVLDALLLVVPVAVCLLALAG